MATDRKLIREEAVALLEAVSQRAPVPVERARHFTGARLVELAEAVAHHCQY